MTIAQGIKKTLVAKRQSALGTAATNNGTAKTFRRVTSTIDLAKETYKSNEILPSQQHRDMRHGVRSVAGTITGELSPGTYQGFMESVLRADAITSALVATASPTGIVATTPNIATAPYEGVFTRTGGSSFLTSGIKVGMVVRWSAGSGTAYTANAGRNLLVTAVTSSVITGIMLDDAAVSTAGAGAMGTAIATAVSNSITAAITSHTKDYWTIEHNYTDITQVEYFTDCVIGQMNIKCPATGMVTVDFPVVGLDMSTGTTAHFATTPAAASTTSILASVNGAVYVAGNAVGTITSIDISVNGNVASMGGVVGTNTAPDVQRGVLEVTGSMSVFFQDATMRDYFINETEVSIVVAFTTSSTSTADFLTIVMPRVKVGGAGKADGQKGLVMTMPFTALENTTSTDHYLSTIAINDTYFQTSALNY